MDLVYLIKLISSREKRGQGEHLEEHATNPPIVHLVVVVPIGEQALWRSVPPGRDILSERWLGIDTSTRPKICQFYRVS